MKLSNINRDKVDLKNIDMQTLCDLIDKCSGDVYLLTNDGNRLNLKSKLCQIVGLTNLIQGGTIAEATLCAINPDYDTMLVRYVLYGELPE